MVADAPRGGPCRPPPGLGGGGWEETRVDDVEVVEVVRLAVEVECGARRIATEADRAAVVCDAGDGDLLAEYRPTRDGGLVAAEGAEQVLELCQQSLVGLGVAVALREVDVPLAVDG